MEQNQNPYPMDHWAQQSPIQLVRDESLFVEYPKGFLSIDYSGAPFAGTFQCEPGHKNFVLSKPARRTRQVQVGSAGCDGRVQHQMRLSGRCRTVEIGRSSHVVATGHCRATIVPVV